MRFRDKNSKPDVNIQDVTIISSDVDFHGTLQTKCDVRIEGKLTGAINSSGRLFVDHKAAIFGPIKGKSAEIAGMVKGDIIVEGEVKLSPSAVVEGSITCGSIIISSGAKIDGTLQTHQEDFEATPYLTHKGEVAVGAKDNFDSFKGGNDRKDVSRTTLGSALAVMQDGTLQEVEQNYW
jgi:cytoskeletal protein CcmA (bactofilin family)